MDTTLSPLARASALPDGSHTSTDFSRAVAQGRLLRLRRGVYITPRFWLNTQPSARYRLMLAATALQLTDPLFCKDSALELHGLPLLNLPKSVHIRARSPGGARTTQQTPMTGSLAVPDFLKKARNTVHDEAEVPAVALRGFPTQRHRPLPGGNSETTRLDLELPTDPDQAVGPCPMSVLAESLELALADTVPRMPFAGAVMALEAALRGGDKRAPVNAEALKNRAKAMQLAQRKLYAVERLLSFASPLSESPGESLLRVRLHELGLPQPLQQVVVHVDGRSYRLDFLWEEPRVALEFDGWIKYRQQRATFDELHKQEKLREDAIRSTGCTVIRVYWEDLMEPGLVRLRSLLQRHHIPREG
ncbi:hypothetical protein [Nesterenkonia alkaliphila]|uniref:DUF559 domain-containing protein n=1 Tax=Nesterenkonia alkaliphila TaxID=1463631 RepID=A0A7K1UKR6_9MICC|nr:hypothetical protein [Nesterenkonia alkaliphila]MVT27087.1 hypothetical protein [Nesterenkonia alkaliphila]GFZ89008.1 hypothetical protein GCM10011359_17860 [Nesterenkonia alkaliphila]